MKPIYIEFACFGPYMESQTVDFTQLDRSGIFLISGETGAGKTTILDAMCVALYGQASGETRGGLEEMRCKLAGKNDETIVDFVFDNGGRRYRFRRSLRTGRTNLIEDHQCMEQRGGEWVPLLANAKKTSVKAMAEEIIGLNYDQFRQVIILPQGQFEKLLTSKSEDKQEILTKLFHTERWDRAVAEVCRQVKERESALQEELGQISAKLNDYDCGSVEELNRKADEDAATLNELVILAEDAASKESEQEGLHAQALLDDAEFQELAQREQSLAGLLQQKIRIEEEERRVKNADAADRSLPFYASLQMAKKSRIKAKEDWDSAKSILEAAERSAKTAVDAWTDHEESRRDFENRKNRLVLLGNARAHYLLIAELQRQQSDLMREQSREAEKSKAADEKYVEADADWHIALESQRVARERYRRGQAEYLRGIGGILADSLCPGEPCPVCGSREHPAPAAKSGTHISDSQLDALAKAEQAAIDREMETREQRGAAEREKSAAAERLAKVTTRLAGVKAALKSAETGKIEGIDTDADLEREITAAKKVIAEFEAEEKDIRNTMEDAQQKYALARQDESRFASAYHKAQSDLEKERDNWRATLASSPFQDEDHFLAACMEPEKRKLLQEKCTKYYANLKTAQDEVDRKKAKLAGKAKPDIESVSADLQKAKAYADELGKQAAVQRKALIKMRGDLAVLIERKAEYDKSQQTLDSDIEFADKLRGATGVSLQRYVLGVRLSAITAAANRLLETVYGGRYQIYRTDEATGRTHKKGLELEVYDAAQNQRRSVNTLSGGEKFLVSLSLAIGLSTVVRASGTGVHMEAMFVDEGFGSLDDKAVDDAVGILHGIRKEAGAVVGIISHVSRLEEIIPAKLEVKKGRNGSTILANC